MPQVIIRIAAGRATDEVLSAMVEGVTDVVATAMDAPLDKVRIEIQEVPIDRVAIGGKFTSELGLFK